MNRSAKTATGNIPDKLKLAIGDAIRLFSMIDSCALEIVWLVTQADLPKKKKLAKEHAANNLKTMEQAIQQIPGAKTDAIWSTCRDLRRERNLIAHGVWLVDESGHPQVTWHARYLESDKYAVVEAFGYERFDYFLERGFVLLNAFAETKRNLEEILPGKWPSQ